MTTELQLHPHIKYESSDFVTKRSKGKRERKERSSEFLNRTDRRYWQDGISEEFNEEYPLPVQSVEEGKLIQVIRKERAFVTDKDWVGRGALSLQASALFNTEDENWTYSQHQQQPETRAGLRGVPLPELPGTCAPPVGGCPGHDAQFFLPK